MPSLNIFSSLKASPAPEKQPDTHIYSVVPTTTDKNIVLIGCAGQQNITYSAKLSTKKSPDVLLWRDIDTDAEPFARATVTKPSCSAELMIHGLTLTMVTDMNYGSTTVLHPTLGRLKWKVGRLNGNPSTLCDENGNELAKHKTIGLHYGGGPRELTILVPHDEAFLDIIVLTVLVARRLSGIASERMANYAAGVSS